MFEKQNKVSFDKASANKKNDKNKTIVTIIAHHILKKPLKLINTKSSEV